MNSSTDNLFLFKPKLQNLKNASKIFFVCHPNDFEEYFEDITDKILEKTADNHISAVFSYANPAISFNFDEVKEYLENMQLVVIPVTWQLLLKPNTVTEKLIPFVLEKHIPILPLVQDPALASEYPKHFGNIQFLCDDKNDKTAIPYDIKLNDFIKETLVGDELRRRVQDAFDAYIFLSYRKKDRKIAQEIMHLIHQNEFCRDIAIWYDEFLTPGEDFNKSIQKAIEKSDLFAMVITPNIVEPNNYIIKHEYPAADTAKKTILPLESIQTDKDKLNKYYENIPSCTDIHNSTALSSALLRNLKITATEENDSPEHNYLIGLAYLTGIDVETNHERGIKLIKKAAEANMPEAVARMATINRTGIGCDINYNQYEYWTDRLIEIFKKQYPLYDSEGWLRLTNSLFGKMLLHQSTNNVLAAKAAAEETIFYANEVKKEKDIYFVTYVLTMANLTLSGVEQQLIANGADSNTNEFTLLNDTFKAGLKGLHEAERIIEEYISRHPEDNAAVLESLTYSQLLSSYVALQDLDSAKKYYEKLMAVTIKQNEQSLIDELEFQWLSLEKALNLDTNNQKQIKEYCYFLINFFCKKEINKTTALAVLQMGFQLKIFAEALLECDHLSSKDIELLESYLKKCLSAYRAIPEKYVTNFILSTLSQILLFGTSLEKRLNRKLQEYHYWKEYSEIIELTLARYDNTENKQKLRDALHVLAFSSMVIKDYDAGYNYGLKYYKLCFEIAKLLPKDQNAHIECVDAVSFLSHYFATKKEMDKSLQYAKSACEMADSIFKYFDNAKTLLCLAKINTEYASLLLSDKKYTEALGSCKRAVSASFKLVDMAKQKGAGFSVDFELEIFDALYDGIKLMGDICFESEDLENAKEHYSYFLKIVGEEKTRIRDVYLVLCRLTTIYIDIKEYKNADQCFKKLVELDPKNKSVKSDYKAFRKEFKEYL